METGVLPHLPSLKPEISETPLEFLKSPGFFSILASSAFLVGLEELRPVAREPKGACRSYWPDGAWQLPLQEARHNCTACHSCVLISAAPADPMHPLLYWFLLGLWSLITYTCSWGRQTGLGETAPPLSSPLPSARAFFELSPWSWI